MSLASVVSTNNSTAGGATSSNAAINSLSSNFNSFLQLLMTQLKNQDPSSPTDTSQFTQELVEFSGVQQQVNTNTNLTSLIQLTQGDSVIQGSALMGKQVTATSSDISLQNGTGSINFTAPGAEPVAVTVTSASGNVITSSVVNATTGANSWSWNGGNASGGTQADGNYAISVQDASGNALPTSTTGTVTGVASSGTTVNVDVNGQNVPLSSVTAVAG